MSYFHEAEPLVIPPAIVRTAAHEAGGLAAHRTDARDFDAAVDAAVAKIRAEFAARERQIVAALFVVQSEIDARGAPLPAMRGDATATGSMMLVRMSMAAALLS